MKSKLSFVVLAFWFVGMVFGIGIPLSWYFMEPEPEPVTTVKFDTLLVDEDGAAVHAVLEVEQEDVSVLLGGTRWRFMPRMEER